MEQHSRLDSGLGICKVRWIRTPRAKHAATDSNRGTKVVVPLIIMVSPSDGNCSGTSPEVYAQVGGVVKFGRRTKIPEKNQKFFL